MKNSINQECHLRNEGIQAVKTGHAQRNAWVSDYDFSDEQGEGYHRVTGMKEWNKRKKERNSEMVALNEFYHDTSKMAPPALRHRRNSYSSIIERLMTPLGTGRPLNSSYNNSLLQTRGFAENDTVKHSSYDYFGTGDRFGDQAVVTMEADDVRKNNGALHGTAKKDFTISAANSKTEDSIQNISTQAASTRTSGYNKAADNSNAEPYDANNVAIASSATIGNNSDTLKETFITSETCNPKYDRIMEKSCYMKRVVEETQTITTD